MSVSLGYTIHSYSTTTPAFFQGLFAKNPTKPHFKQKNDLFKRGFSHKKRSYIIFGNIFEYVAYLTFEVIAYPRQHRQVNACDLVVAVAVELGRTKIAVFDKFVFAYPSGKPVLVQRDYNFAFVHCITSE